MRAGGSRTDLYRTGRYLGIASPLLRAIPGVQWLVCSYAPHSFDIPDSTQ